MYVKSVLVLCMVYSQGVFSQWEQTTTTSDTKSFEIRLVDGDTASEGRLEVQHQGIWGTVCDDGFDIAGAEVVCRQLGYDLALGVKPSAFYGKGDGNILLDDIECDGDEETLAQCEYPGWGKHNCRSVEDVGVQCGNIKDGELPIRLTYNYRPNFGHVQAFYNGTWGNICGSNSWGLNEANVACKQLGYNKSIRSYNPNSKYIDPDADNDIVISAIRCQGYEEKIIQCDIEYPYYEGDRCYSTASVDCRMATVKGLTPGKVAGVTLTCLLLVVMLIVVPLAMFRCKPRKLPQPATTDGSQANVTSGVTPVVYTNSLAGAPQVVLPYGSTPAAAYGQSGQVFYEQMPAAPPQLMNESTQPPQAFDSPPPPSLSHQSHGVHSTPSTWATFPEDVNTAAVSSERGAGGGVQIQEKVPLT